MKLKFLPLLLIISFFIKPAESIAQVNTQDSLALVDFYNSTNGPNWFFGHWDLNTPVASWQGITLENNRVKNMELRGACRGGKILPSFGNLNALTSIYFLDCTLTDATLPDEFKNLTNLKSLTLHAVFSFLPFPAVITKMPNLTTVDFEDNYFTDTIPSGIGNLTNLTYLSLSNINYTNGSKIPVELGNLTKLTTLLLSNGNLIDTIPSSFGNLESLNALGLSYNQLKGTIPLGLNSLEDLEYLNLQNNQFTFESIEPFLQSATSVNKIYTELLYHSQASIHISRYQDKITVSAGGTLSNNTYKWYGPNGATTVTGDSTYTPTSLGDYTVYVTNSLVPNLTLSSDTINFQVQIADSTTTVSTNISGTDTTFINDGFFKIAAVKPIDGPNALNGNITSIVTIDPAVSSYNMQPYVQRHYDITPAVNPLTSQAIVVLYFTQQDFDNYNEYVTTNGLAYPLLPTGGINNGNVRISQFHGSFAVTPDPENYGTNRVLITPSASWDAVNKWWALTFPVNGFSGFFVTTGNSVLPLTLIKFMGSMSDGKVALRWTTENETTTKDFIIERSNDGTNFKNIGKVAAMSISGKHVYNFEDTNRFNGNNFYRLRMTDKDLHSSYSSIIMIYSGQLSTQLSIYPNPAKSVLNIKFSLDKKAKIYTKIIDASGRVIEKITVEANVGISTIPINIEKLSKGIYYLETAINGVKERMSFVKN